MELDIGATKTILSQGIFDGLFKNCRQPKLEPVYSTLRTYTGERIDVFGAANVKIMYGNATYELQLLSVPS